MAVTSSGNVRNIGASGDTIGAADAKILIKGIRLVAGADAATVVVRQDSGTGVVLCKLAAGIGLADEMNICLKAQGVLHFTITGTAPVVVVYLD